MARGWRPPPDPSPPSAVLIAIGALHANVLLAPRLFSSDVFNTPPTAGWVPLDIATNVMAYKRVAAASSLILIVLVWRAASLRGLSPVRAAALVGLNPVIVLYGVGGGHNDLMMLAILAAAIHVLLQERERRGGALIVSAVGIEPSGFLVPGMWHGCSRSPR